MTRVLPRLTPAVTAYRYAKPSEGINLRGPNLRSGGTVAMLGGKPVRDVTVFVSLYLVLSMPPFLLLNRDLSPEISGVATLATLGTAALFAIAGLFLAGEGVGRYRQFLSVPPDTLSVVVDAAFVLAPVSWWVAPEVAFYYEVGPDLGVLLGVVLICHIPLVLFLSLMTAIGRAKRA